LLFSSSGNTAIRRASSRVSSLAAERPRLILEIDMRERLSAGVADDKGSRPILRQINKRHLAPSGDARLIACRTMRERRRGSATVRGFNDKLLYQKLRY
jgi:hypothetical protein